MLGWLQFFSGLCRWKSEHYLSPTYRNWLLCHFGRSSHLAVCWDLIVSLADYLSAQRLCAPMWHSPSVFTSLGWGVDEESALRQTTGWMYRHGIPVGHTADCGNREIGCVGWHHRIHPLMSMLPGCRDESSASANGPPLRGHLRRRNHCLRVGQCCPWLHTSHDVYYELFMMQFAVSSFMLNVFWLERRSHRASSSAPPPPTAFTQGLLNQSHMP